MADRDVEEVRDRIADMISDAVGELVTGWTVIVDTITDNSKTATWWIVAQGQTDPTTLGHVRWVDKRIGADIVRGTS